MGRMTLVLWDIDLTLVDYSGLGRRFYTEALTNVTTFSDILANALRAKLKRLISNEPRLAERLEVHSIDGIGLRLFKANLGDATAQLKIIGQVINQGLQSADGFQRRPAHGQGGTQGKMQAVLHLPRGQHSGKEIRTDANRFQL